MDLKPMQVDQPEPAASPEPSSTRPNPFDDGDIASRKRRRTSLSDSPARMLDTILPTHDTHMSSTSDTNMASLDAPNEVGKGSSTRPQTPEQQTASQDSPSKAPPSTITINLRNALTDEPSSPTPSSRPMNGQVSPSPVASANDVKKSVEELDVELVNIPEQEASGTSLSGSALASPAIEVINILEDDEMSLEEVDAGVTIVNADRPRTNPLLNFPYKEPDEPLLQTLNRTIHYFSTQATIDVEVIASIQQWLTIYLGYANNAGVQAQEEACRQYRTFWMLFPDIILAMTGRKYSLLKSPEFRRATLTFYVAFARLTAWFVTIDGEALEAASLDADHQRSRCPDLMSPLYLQQLHSLTQWHGPFEPGSDHEAASHSREDSAHIVSKLQSFEGGSLPHLAKIAIFLIDNLIPTYPRLFDSLASICQIAADIMRESFNSLLIGNTHALQMLELGHALHDKLYQSLLELIKNQVTHLNIDHVSAQIDAMTEMLRLGLHGSHQHTHDVLSEYRKRFPDLPSKYTIEAIVREERFNILAKLIRSGQMQLRVMATTLMCGDLVSRWRFCTNAGEDENSPYFQHVADYFSRTGLIEYILGANCHPEIIVQSANIIGFLVVTKNYRKEHTDLLWQGITSSQDPRVSEALTRMVSGIIGLFDYTGLLGLCEKLQTLPIAGFTPSLRKLGGTVVQNMATRATAEEISLSLRPYEFCLDLAREASIYATGSQAAYPETQEFAMERLAELLFFEQFGKQRDQVYANCIADISSKSRTTLGSLWCLSTAIRSIPVSQFRTLIKTYDLARLIVDELDHAIESARKLGVQMVLSGGINQARRDLISRCLHLEPHTIDDEIGERLWSLLVGDRSLCSDDRRAGWAVLNHTARTESFVNPFLRNCFSNHLPVLRSVYFCDGMLDFVRSEIEPRISDSGDMVLDDEEMVVESGIEQLWRIILCADDEELVDKAINTLAIGVYLDSKAITRNTLQRNRRIHISLANRCLRQLKEAARIIANSRHTTPSPDDSSMVLVSSEDQIQEQERIFTRSLKFLHTFLVAHRSRPRFAAPDVRTLISQDLCEVTGDSAELKYQSFDGTEQTEVKPLAIGRLNTAASLLASIRQATGFENYRVFYRGQPFLPDERDIYRSLEDLCIHHGLILVKRENDGQAPSVQMKPGASSLEMEVSAHFDELWEYLSMGEKLAEEIYQFLVKLPTDGHVLKAIKDHDISYREVFPPGQPYKSLYAVHALVDYALAARPKSTRLARQSALLNLEEPGRDKHLLQRSIFLIVQAISDVEVFECTSRTLQMKLNSSLMHAYLRFLNGVCSLRDSPENQGIDVPTCDRLVDILSNASTCNEADAFPLISSTLAVIWHLAMRGGKFWGNLERSSTFSSLFQSLLLSDPRKSIRKIVAKQVEDIVHFEKMHNVSLLALDGVETLTDSVKQYLWSIIFELIPQAVTTPSHCGEAFRVASVLLADVASRSLQFVDVEQLATTAFRLLMSHASTEDINQPEVEDPIVTGLVVCLFACLQIRGSLSNLLPEDAAHALFWKQLYPKEREEAGDPVSKIIINNDSRAKLNEVIVSLVENDGNALQAMWNDMNTLVPYSTNEEDEPYFFELPYHFERFRALRSSCGYAGLQNLSNTCYLNSLLTQLFMNTGFRQFILNARMRDNLDSQQLLFHTRRMFGLMQESYRRSIDPTHFVNSIKTYDDTLIDIHNQMDVDEFYNLLFDRWEGQMMNSSERKALRSFYGGQIVQQVKSKECEHVSERLEPFSAIQCDIKGKETLTDSLQAYVDGEILEGDNKYKCSACDRHVDAVKRACLKDIPDNMIFHLKRFDFNLRTLQRHKINDHFSFPSRIDLRPYTIEHLSDPSSDGEPDIFELVGVLVHSGTAESGHYYSYIRERPTLGERQTWVEFNDDLVSPWDPASMQRATFGGQEPTQGFDDGVAYDKTYSAYMLFYQRATALEAEQEKMQQRAGPGPSRATMQPDLSERILDENTAMLRRHCLFDPAHLQLVHRLFEHTSTLLDTNSLRSVGVEGTHILPSIKNLREAVMCTMLSHMDQVVSREKDLPSLQAYTLLITDAVASSYEWAILLYDYFSERHEAFRSLIQRHPDPGVRIYIGKMFLQSLEKISDSLPNVCDQEDSHHNSGVIEIDDADAVDHYNSVLEGTVSIFNHLWQYFHVHIRSWDEYFGILHGFAGFGEREVAALLAEDYLLRTVRIIAADTMIELPHQYARMLANIMRRMNSRPPSYAALINLISLLMQHLSPTLGPDSIVETPAERLSYSGKPFRWTANEVQMVHMGFGDEGSSLFVEKLLNIDQAPEATDKIIQFLTQTSPRMDKRVLVTLTRNIRGDASQPMNPFLRAAVSYIEATSSVDNATRMVQHVSMSAKGLQGSEGQAFLEFCRAALNLEREEQDVADMVKSYSLTLVHKWAPYLLVYVDEAVRQTTYDILLKHLLQWCPLSSVDDNGLSLNQALTVSEAIKELGVSCLEYLQEYHIGKGAQLSKGRASSILQVIRQCKSQYEPDISKQDAVDDEFLTTEADIQEAVARLIVDEVEDDGSDWEGSCGSSEHVDDLVEMTSQTMNDANDVTLV